MSHTHGSPSAPWVSHATASFSPRGGSAAPTRPDEYRKLLRWNGCGCRVVLRWLAKRRGPRAGHSSKTGLRPAPSLSGLGGGVALYEHPHLHGTHRRPAAVDAPSSARTQPHRPRKEAPHVHAPLLSEATAWEGTGKRVEEEVHQTCADLRMMTPLPPEF